VITQAYKEVAVEISFSQKSSFTCPQCNTVFDVEVWLIVDTIALPGLLNRIRNGTIHDLTCPKCDQTVGKVDAPLLLYRPNETLPLLYSPAQQTTSRQDHEQFDGLIGILRQHLGNIWKDAWLEQGVSGIPRPLLPAVLSDDPEAAMLQIAEQVRLELDSLRQRDPDTYHRLAQAVEQSSQQLSPLLQAIQEFIEAHTWAASYSHIKSHTDLLSEETDELLKRLITSKEQEGNIKAVRVLENHRSLLRRCREIGIDHAFAEKMGIVPEEFQIGEPLLISRTFDALVNAPTWEETRSILEEHQALLLSDFARALLQSNIAEMHSRDETEEAEEFESYLNLLGDARVLGIEAAWQSFEEKLGLLPGLHEAIEAIKTFLLARLTFRLHEPSRTWRGSASPVGKDGR
jgi:hypothetical protein